jgi:hypothetical protein
MIQEFFVAACALISWEKCLPCCCLAKTVSSGSTIPALSPHVTVFLKKEVPYGSQFFRFDLEYASRNVQENKETDIEWVTSASGQYKCHKEEK